MPIAGLTDRSASFPLLGKLRKGAEKPGKGPGKDLEYFRLDTERSHAQKVFEQFYGTEPTEIRCWLPYPGVEDNFSSWMEEWNASSLVRRCDRRTQSLCLDGNKYTPTSQPCLKQCGCKPVGRLSIIVQEFLASGIVGFLTVETHSVHDIMTLTENLSAAFALRPNLCGIPFILRRSPREVSVPMSNGSRSRKRMYLLSIEPDAAWVQKQLQGLYQHAMALPGGSGILELPRLEDYQDDRALTYAETQLAIAPAPDTTYEATSQDGLISERQRKRLFAIAKQHCLSTDGLKCLLADHGCFDENGSASSKAVPVTEYDAIIVRIQDPEIVGRCNAIASSEPVEAIASPVEVA